MPEKKRFLKSVNVNFISLVDKGANQKRIIYKSADPAKNTYQKIVQLVKFDEEQHTVYGIVYSPDQADSEGDFTTAEVIKQMSYDFMKARNTNNVDQQHDYNPDEGFIAESWLLEKNDPRFPEEPEGSWAVAIKVVKEDTWEKIKSGEITGLSMAGLAVVEEVQKSDSLIDKISKAIRDGFASLTKDFNSHIKEQDLREGIYALERSMCDALNDETITDKKSALIENVSQFITFLNSSADLAKAGKVFNSKNLANLKNMQSMIAAMIAQMEADQKDNIQKNNNGEIDMTPEEIQALVTKSVNDAVAPLQTEITALKTENSTLKTAAETDKTEFEKRIKDIEEATPGSAQARIKEEVKKQEVNAYTGPAWLS